MSPAPPTTTTRLPRRSMSRSSVPAPRTAAAVGKSRVSHVLVQYLESFRRDPLPDLLRAIPVRRRRPVPVVVRHHIRFPIPVGVVEALEDVPVEPPLEVEASGADPELGNVRGDVDRDLLLGERLAEPGDRLREPVRLLLRHRQRRASKV